MRHRMNTHAAAWLCALATLVTLSVWSAPAAATQWQEIGPAPIVDGPYVGRCSAVAASPTDPDRYFVAGATGGVWRTTDGGETWQPLTDYLPASAIGALTLDPFDENIVYAGTGEANFANHSIYGLGLYKSTDGGDTWEVLGEETFAGRTFSRIVVSHANPQVLYVSIMHAGGFPARVAAKGHPLANGPVGVFKSTDGGVTWTHLLNGLPGQAASDVWIDPSDENILYAAIGDVFGLPENGIYKSYDAGNSWVKLENGLPSGLVGRITLAIAPSDPQRLYTIITNPCDEFGGGASTNDVYRTANGGEEWLRTFSGNFQATYGWFLSTAIVHPTDPNLFFVGGLSLLRSTNGGGQYQTVTPQHVDMHGLCWDASGRLLCANDGGLHRSSSNGSSWEALNEGLGTIQFYPGISAHPTLDHYILGGVQDNGTNLLWNIGNGREWRNKIGGDGGCTSVGVGFTTMAFGEFQGANNLYRSSGFGSFIWVGGDIAGGDRHCFVPPVIHDPNDWSRLFHATQRIWRSDNYGADWSPISGDLTGGDPAAVRALTIAPSNSQAMYAATNDGRVLASTDAGVNWELKLEGVPGWPRLTRELAVDPGDDATVYLAVGRWGRGSNPPLNRSGDHLDGAGRKPARFAGELRGGPPRGRPACGAGRHRSRRVRGLRRRDQVVEVRRGFAQRPGHGHCDKHPFNRMIIGTLGRGAWILPLPNFTDADGDGDMDLIDLQPMQNCFSGPSDAPWFEPPDESCLAQYDFDLDGDVDLFDLSVHVGRLSPPQ